VLFILLPEAVLGCAAKEVRVMRDADELRRCYRLVFEGEAGRAVLADIEARAYVRETSFVPDGLRAAFNEGRRSLALHIRRMCEAGQGRREE
jgi:hypothetical protein